jgi:hypothetical protein
MASVNHHRHWIQQMLAQRPDAMVNTSIDLWDELGAVLNLTVGEVAFQTLFSSSIRSAGKRFPWMTGRHVVPSVKLRFEVLRTCLEGQVITESSAASAFLLNTFIDSLIVLLGEELTANILMVAWGDWSELPAPA